MFMGGWRMQCQYSTLHSITFASYTTQYSIIQYKVHSKDFVAFEKWASGEMPPGGPGEMIRAAFCLKILAGRLANQPCIWLPQSIRWAFYTYLYSVGCILTFFLCMFLIMCCTSVSRQEPITQFTSKHIDARTTGFWKTTAQMMPGESMCSLSYHPAWESHAPTHLT